MRKIEPSDLLSSLEPGYLAVSLSTSEPRPAVSVCLVMRAQPDPVAGSFIFLRRTPLADIFLGCLADSASRPVEWLEIWVQNTENFSSYPPGKRASLSNACLDEQWTALAAELADLSPEAYINTPYEQTPLPPLPVSPATASPTPLRDAGSAQLWALCRDDAKLTEAGLPEYSTSLHRYLVTPACVGEARFIPLSTDAPLGERTSTLAAEFPAAAHLPLWNARGARMLLRKFSPLSAEEFTEVLSGKAWRGVENARKAYHPGGVYALLEDEDFLRCSTAHLFSAQSGRGGRLAETLHLKLQLLLQALRLTREKIRHSQLPLLHLSPESFRIRLGATGLDLPFLWTAQLSLIDPSLAYPLPIAHSTERYFQSLEPLTASIYRPAELALSRTGVGSVRIRKVLPSPEGVVLEGTLSTQERIGLDESEMLWVQLPVASSRVDLYGFRDTTQAMAAGEAFFRTIPQKLSDAEVAGLQAVAGVPFNQVAFQVLPTLSSPCDLYSLGVLATRVLLVDLQQALPQALDAILSLVQQLAAAPDASLPLPERLKQLVASDARWQVTLGPQHLRHEESTPEEAFSAIPAKLWWDILGLIARFFPGRGPDSFCKGFGDAPGLALHTIFDEPIQQLEALAIRSRALITLGWQQNLEIASLIAAAEAKS